MTSSMLNTTLKKRFYRKNMKTKPKFLAQIKFPFEITFSNISADNTL